MVQGLVSVTTLGSKKGTTEHELWNTVPSIGKLQGQTSQHLVSPDILHKSF